jgi:photosystem II stability/assembly factor-like uncharacterized protein
VKFILLPIIITFFLCTQLLYAQWTDVALPAGHGGAVHSLCVNGTKLFAGKNEGIYVSDDNGLHWRKINPNLPARYSSKPNLRSIVATDEYMIVGGLDMDVHISTDDGESWTKQGLEIAPRTVPSRIAADGDWIICGSPIINSTFSRQSTDRGQSWSSFPAEIGPIATAAIQDSIALIGTESGIFRSADYGSTWIKVNGTHTPLSEEIPIAFSDSNAFAVFYRSSTKYFGGNILSSPDRGLTWPDTSFLACSLINSIVFSPAEADSDFIFAATDSGVFRSSDNGVNWVKKNNGLGSDLIFSLVFKVQGTAGTPLLFAGTGNGIFSSSDYGNNWTEVGSPAEWLFTAFGTDIFAVSSQTTYIGWSKYTILESGTGYKTVVCHSKDNGSSWAQTYSGNLDRSQRTRSLVINSHGILFAVGTWGPSLFIEKSIVSTSENGGSNWEMVYIDSSTSNPLLGAQSSDVYMSTYGFGNGGISRFFNDGNSWEKLYPVFAPFAVGMDTIKNPWVSAFSFEENKVYISATGKYTDYSQRPPLNLLVNLIAVSTDNGQTWERIASPLDSVTEIHDEWNDTLSILTKTYPAGAHIMVGMRSQNFFQPPYSYPFANGGGFYHLYYDGSKWTLADTAFTNTSVFGFAAKNSKIFAATENGVFSTNNYGTDWKEINSGMGSKMVNDLFITNSYLFASTTNGVWKRPLSEITSTGGKNTDGPFPQKFSLSQNYPNPFNPTTIIHYQLKTKGHVQLTIYDITGQEVKKLVNQNQNTGEYSVNFNAGNFASGIYIYRLKTDSFEQSRKMILLR